MSNRLGKKMRTAAGLALILLGLAACTTTYDEQTDKGISSLQHQVDQKIVALVSLDRKIDSLQNLKTDSAQKALEKAKEDASYDANVSFYDGVNTDLTSLQMRADAIPDFSTPKLDETFANLRGVLMEAPRAGGLPTSMQAVHASQGRLSEAFLLSTRSQANALFATILQYELTLKAGETPSK
jgi:hypothetical protein